MSAVLTASHTAISFAHHELNSSRGRSRAARETSWRSGRLVCALVKSGLPGLASSLLGGSVMSVASVVRPRVWVGCLSCYNAGELVGSWVDAEDAVSVTADRLHGSGFSGECEELWCFDVEGLPAGIGEIDPGEAASWGVMYEALGDAQWPALVAWTESESFVMCSDGLPSLPDFEERYRGCWPSFDDYLAEEIDEMQRDWPDEAIRYFDEAAYERDARVDYTVLDAPGGGVYVFTEF